MIRKRPITVTVNGSAYARDIEPRRLLTDFLREDLGLTGTHVGCEHGVCGACSCLAGRRIGPAPAYACQCRQMVGRLRLLKVWARLAALSLLQEKFRKHHALQCGFCTPGHAGNGS
jgi:carbon-monoxide dehydrogenase small subunit